MKESAIASQSARVANPFVAVSPPVHLPMHLLHLHSTLYRGNFGVAEGYGDLASWRGNQR